MDTIVYKIADNIDLVALAKRLCRRGGTTLFLSAMEEHPRSRYSFLCVEPFLTFRSFDSVCRISTANGISYAFGNPCEIIRTVFRRYEIDGESDLPLPLGGAFGYFGYDLKNHLEPKAKTNPVKDIPLPDCYLNFYDAFLVFDHKTREAFVISTGIEPDGSRDRKKAELRIKQWERFIQTCIPESELPPTIAGGYYEDLFEFNPDDTAVNFENLYDFSHKFYSDFTKDGFIEAVKKSKRYIYQGDIYQVNLSQRFEIRDDEIHPFDLFESLLITSPAPFAAYINAGDFQFVSSSPELFLKMDGNHIITCPIKGTRPRGSNPEESRRMLLDLQSSEKERAELVMITDLLRNDLGKVCKYGSVLTTEFLKIEQHPTVYHMVSTIEGELKDGTGHLDALFSCFPGGSITGAPKIRAMQIIDELEPVARGIYTGTHGYIGFNQRSQFSITIRTAICAKNYIWYQSGAGIVADSEPQAEYEETIVKAVAFFKAVEIAGQKKKLVLG